jgi:hypothetical protein
MSDELKDCAHCGGLGGVGSDGSVICDDCGADLPSVAAWNRRPTPDAKLRSEIVARAIYDYLEGPVNNQDAGRQMRQWKLGLWKKRRGWRSARTYLTAASAAPPSTSLGSSVSSPKLQKRKLTQGP